MPREKNNKNKRTRLNTGCNVMNPEYQRLVCLSNVSTMSLESCRTLDLPRERRRLINVSCLKSSSHRSRDGSSVPPQLETITAAARPVSAPPGSGCDGGADGKFLGSFQNKTPPETLPAGAGRPGPQVILRRRSSAAACVLQNQSGATVAELIMVDTWGGVLHPPFLPPSHTVGGGS